MWYFIFAIILTVVAAIVDMVGKDKDKDWNNWIFFPRHDCWRNSSSGCIIL